MRWHCACIDVDETLYNYSQPLYESFISDGLTVGPPEEWNCWDYIYPDYMTKEQATKHFDLVHQRQLEFEPYKEARDFLQWACNNYYVVITSHRKPEREGVLKEWLKRNNLVFDELYVCQDKTEMFNKAIFRLVVDDNPYILKAAAEKGIRAVGLRKPWNVNHVDKKIELYDTLEEIWK